jgi:hypothetical protein
VTLNFDTSRAPLGTRQLADLIRAIKNAHPTDEATWLEWKSGLDLSQPAGRASVARCIVGFANRMPDVARRHCEGRAYMVLGAEPGRIAGLEPIDGANLEPWVNGYLGPNPPRWTSHWVDADERSVLVIEVAAPQPGEAVFCIWRESDKIRDGDVYVRRNGATHRASASELQALVERAKGGAPTLTGLSLRATVPVELTPVNFSKSAQEAWLESERDECLASLRKHRAAQRRAEAESGDGISASRFRDLAAADGAAGRSLRDHMAEMASAQQRMASMLGSLTRTVAEDRSEDQYERQVERYIADCRDELPSALREAASAALVPVSFIVENATDDNYAQVVVKVYCPGDVDGGEPSSYVSRNKGLPRRPRPFGPRQEAPYALQMPTYSAALASGLSAGLSAPGPGFDIERGGSVRLTFDPVDVRPQQQHVLPETVLLPGKELSAVRVEWSATSTSVSGVVRGSFELPVVGEPWQLEEALAYEPADGDDPDD